MSFTNSSLVNVTRISPNRTSPRENAIDTITIHCVVGRASVESLGALFAQASRQASSNYGIGPDGRVGMYVEEKDRSWCSSSRANDNRAVTIEVASDTTHPYAVTSAAYDGTIRLVADICKRNGIKELKWKADKSLIGQTDKQNMTAHRWFANKACPGDYLYSRFGDIAKHVNNILDGTSYPVLRHKYEGDDVKRLQTLLVAAGYDTNGVDGVFGNGTLEAVKKYQENNGLETDGIVGDATWTSLVGSKPEPTTNKVRVLSERPIYKECPEAVGKCGKGVYTIVDTSGEFGKLKSGAGWISLSDTKKV